MADLEKLALQRDRGYLVRLVLMLLVGLLASVFLFGWLTGSGVHGCVAETIGGESKAAGSGPKPH